ncbi:MFS general substrate transporter [Coprinopsis marcescibilis]|uniref:MFS general substrate transporter n=1 Tax=Coprinopsis marcescibilis TaxID=230819 RepID=A0A5C3KUQ2_COPMA|nr:MFS general substrate transporter [Coprinopsis marcescibilis]
MDNNSKASDVQEEKVSISLDETSYVIDPDAEKRLVKKLDWALLPLFTITYVCNYIDRTAIGNARVAGLEEDLGMENIDLNIALTIFYVFYTFADIPSNLLLKRYGSHWLAFTVVGFGVITLFSAFLKSYEGLIVTRVFLGLCEGGTLPGLVYIMSRYYRKTEFVLRVGIFFGIAPNISGAFGGLLASGLLKIGDFGFITTWRKIFLIEGIITTAWGISLFWILPTDPATSKMLNEEERKLALARIDADQIVKTGGVKEKTTWRLVIRSFNFNTTICTICFILLNISFQGLGLFLPTVVRTLGNFSVVEIQLRTVPPFLVGGLWSLTNTYLSYRTRKRWVPIITSVALVVVGYAISISTKNVHARYAACFIMIAGGSVGGSLLVIWGTDNAAPDTMRAVVSAAIPGIGALGSIVSVWTYVPSDAPDYRRGNSANLGTTSTIVVLLAIKTWSIYRENAKRARGERDYRVEGKTQEQIAQLGYKHPEFRYQV